MSLSLETHRMVLLITQGKNYPEQRIARFRTNGTGPIIFLPDNLPLDHLGSFLVTENVPRSRASTKEQTHLDDRDPYAEWLDLDDYYEQRQYHSEPRTTYRARPVPIDIAERWVETKAGQLVYGRVGTDYLGELGPIEVIEERDPVERYGIDEASISEFLAWGDSLATTRFVVETQTLRPIEREVIDADDQLVWQVVRHQPVGKHGTKHAVKLIDVIRKELSVTYQDTWLFELRVVYWSSASTTSVTMQEIPWGKLPQWLKERIDQQYPVCDCGKMRIDTDQVTQKHYHKCRACLQAAMKDISIAEPPPAARPTLNTNPSRRLLERMRRW